MKEVLDSTEDINNKGSNFNLFSVIIFLNIVKQLRLIIKYWTNCAWELIYDTVYFW